jgi:hypothetical protein
MNVGDTGLGERFYRPVAAGRLIAAGSAASKSRPSYERLIPVGCRTQWVPSPQRGLGPPSNSLSSSRCRSASLSIGYAMAIHKPMAVGGTRVVGSGMRVGRPAGGSSWPPRTHHPGAARPARRVVVGNLGYDVSFTRPKSYSLLPAFADSDIPATVEAVYTEAGGARLRLAGARSPSAARRSRRCSPTWVRPRGGVPGGAAGGRAAHPGSEDRGGRGPGRHPARALAGRGPRRRLGPGGDRPPSARRRRAGRGGRRGRAKGSGPRSARRRPAKASPRWRGPGPPSVPRGDRRRSLRRAHAERDRG